MLRAFTLLCIHQCLPPPPPTPRCGRHCSASPSCPRVPCPSPGSTFGFRQFRLLQGTMRGGGLLHRGPHSPLALCALRVAPPPPPASTPHLFFHGCYHTSCPQPPVGIHILEGWFCLGSGSGSEEPSYGVPTPCTLYELGHGECKGGVPNVVSERERSMRHLCVYCYSLRLVHSLLSSLGHGGRTPRG